MINILSKSSWKNQEYISLFFTFDQCIVEADVCAQKEN